MFSKFVGLLRSFGGPVAAGVDKNGNSYFRKMEKIDGSALVERRWVEFKGAPDPRLIPVEWNSWLAGRRKEAPTPQEIMDLEAKREKVRSKVQLLAQEEERSRLRTRVLSEDLQADKGGPGDMHIILRQIGSEESRSAKPKTEDSGHGQYIKDVNDSAASTAWNPQEKDERFAEEESQGDKFRPGVWRP